MGTLTFETTLDLLARDLPHKLVHQINSDPANHVYGPSDEVPDIEVLVEYHPGYEEKPCRSGHPDNWTPGYGEEPSIVKVTSTEGDHDLTETLDKIALARLVEEAWEAQKRAEFDPTDCSYDDAYDSN
jgi:hypothetical protein